MDLGRFSRVSVVVLTRVILMILLASWLPGCDKADSSNQLNHNHHFIKAIDLSSYPEISQSNSPYFDSEGNAIDLIDFVKANHVNTIRLRLWVNPSTPNSGLDEVAVFSERLHAKGFKIWLSLHYSDHWADPASQQTPGIWQTASFKSLKDSVFNYTRNVMNRINPEYIQIGNEINSGILHPFGNIVNNELQFYELLKEGIRAVRVSSNSTKIILHYAGFKNAEFFFEQLNSLDYDIIGLSFYPFWHGKSMQELEQALKSLAETQQKPILIAETAYPFTLQWSDLTHNVVGLDSQLIVPDFPASEVGQKEFLNRIKSIVKNIPGNRGAGFCYWGAELIAWKGTQSSTGSSWENQALFDFNQKALPAWNAFADF